MILFEKYGQHQPLNRQPVRYAHEGVDLSLSTLADQVGGCALLLRLLYDLIRDHVFAGARVHGDETTVPVLAKGKTRTGRLWTYVRDDKPFGGADPPAAAFFYSRDRTAEHPERHPARFTGVLQADAYAGFNRLYAPERSPGRIIEAACWSHGRRNFFVLADIAANARNKALGKQTTIGPLAWRAVERVGTLNVCLDSGKVTACCQKRTGRRRAASTLYSSLEDEEMSLTDIGVEFDAYGIGEVLRRNRLRVPDNKRVYAWRDEHVQTLFEDIAFAYDKKPSPYFLVTIVLTGEGREILDVADGQQRPATTSILIAAIRDFLFTKTVAAKRASDKYTNEYLVKYDEFSNDEIPQLQLGVDDNDFFLKSIVSHPTSEQRINVISKTNETGSIARLASASDLARKFVKSLVSKYSEKDAITHLFEFVKFIQSSVIIIIITTSEEIDAYKMFETLNDRGLKASQTDTLKNFLFSEGKCRLSEIKPRLSSMLAKIESYDEELLVDYVRHYWITKAGQTRSSELAKKFKEAVSGKRHAIETIISLDNSATYYISLLQPLEHPRLAEFGQDTRLCIHTVTNILGIVQIRPLMLAVLENFSVNEARVAFAKFASWSVRFLIVGSGGCGVLDKHYSQRAH